MSDEQLQSPRESESRPLKPNGKPMYALRVLAEARTALLGGEHSAVAHMLGVDTVDRIADS